MTRNEFLSGLRKALENDLKGNIVIENVEYYSSYIKEEVRKGRSEKEVVDELGDPWVVARSIIEMKETAGEIESGGAYEEREGGNMWSEDARFRVFSLNTWWKILLLLLGVMGIILVLLMVVGGILSFVAPFILPVFIFAVIVRFFKRR